MAFSEGISGILVFIEKLMGDEFRMYFLVP